MSIISDFNSWYVSGAQASIYIGSYLLDDTLRVNLQFTSGAQPIYSAFDNLFRAVVPGQGVASGTIVTAYQDEGYIEALLNKYQEMHNSLQQAHSFSPSPGKDVNEIQNKGNAAADASPIIGDGMGIFLMDDKNAHDNRNKLKEKIWGSNNSYRGLPLLYTTPFTIKVYHGSPDDKDVGEEHIYNAIITGKQKAFDNTGSPINEIYSFIGKIML